MVNMRESKSGLYIRDELICSRIVRCDTLAKKGLGLMFRSKKAVEDTAWLFSFRKPRKIGLTMMFVFFKIDVLFLDSSRKIVEFATLKPWTFYNPRSDAMHCIELKHGTIARYAIKQGDVLDFDP